MSFAYREEQRADQQLDALTDEADGLRIVVARRGAELISLARRDANAEWRGFLHRDNNLEATGSGWTNHSTVMGYYLHRLKDRRSVYRGKEIRGGTHGFLRITEWHFDGSHVGEGKLLYRVTPEDYGPSDYPLRVSLELSYILEHGAVRTRFHFRNHESDLTAHVGFGLHPGFAAEAFQTFHLDMPAGRYRRWFSPTNYLSGETYEFVHSGGDMPFPREKLPGSFIVEFLDVPERTFRYFDRASGREVILDLTGVPYFTLWSDGGPFLCVEPCWGLTDHVQQRPFEEKAGMQTIAPGSELVAEFTMEPRLLQ